MDNKIIISVPQIEGNRINYKYKVTGEWNEVFNDKEEFFAEYSCDISNVPSGVAVIPLLANVLPIAWIYDAEIIVPVCDKDFYDSIEQFKKGYKDMYPMIDFKGLVTVDKLENNKVTGNGSAAFFSGGVDAFNTLVCHMNEKPALITLWGADVKFEDTEGWDRVRNHLQTTAGSFGLEYVYIKTGFRRFIKERELSPKVRISGDGWWHGFQHGIGIISHAAPALFAMGKNKVYIASSFTAAEKGKVTCASDPTIDNNVRFCGASVHHDGYEFNRQMKIHNITQFSNKTGIKIPLRVCWQSTGGSNCCECEKCWRTILGIYAEGFDPREFGFDYDDKKLKMLSKKMRYGENKLFGTLRYAPIQNAMRNKVNKNELPSAIRWFYDVDLTKVGKLSFAQRCKRKIKRIVNGN